MNALYHTIHRVGPLANLAYKSWHKIYDFKEKHLVHSRFQIPSEIDGAYEMGGLNTAITAICNSKCVFCVHHLLGQPTDIMPNELFADVLKAWSVYDSDKTRVINFTPGSPPGEPLCDPGLMTKLKMCGQYGFPVLIITNAILLHKFSEKLVNGGVVKAMGISLASLDPEVYHDVYGVDQGKQVVRNLFELLELNKQAGEPITITIAFRNKESPKEVIRHPDYKKLASYFSPQVAVRFTTWWDNWNGGVKREDMERGWIKVRRPLNLNRVCIGALEFTIRPTDRKIRLCGCRYLQGVDDLVVGDIDEGFAAARLRAVKIQDGFKIGVRPQTCTNCGAYKQA